MLLSLPCNTRGKNPLTETQSHGVFYRNEDLRTFTAWRANSFKLENFRRFFFLFNTEEHTEIFFIKKEKS